MKCKIDIECPELESFMDVAPVPQTHVDLAALEYRKAQDCAQWLGDLALYWAALIHTTLKNSRN